MIKSYRDLNVWQKAVELVAESYRVARLLPKTEMCGLVSQIQRSATSIPANIAEGHGRDHLGDYIRHLSIANGSLMEFETHFLVARKLGYIRPDDLDPILAQTAEVGRMLAGLTKKLKALCSRLTPGT